MTEIMGLLSPADRLGRREFVIYFDAVHITESYAGSGWQVHSVFARHCGSLRRHPHRKHIGTIGQVCVGHDEKGEEVAARSGEPFVIAKEIAACDGSRFDVERTRHVLLGPGCSAIM